MPTDLLFLGLFLTAGFVFLIGLFSKPIKRSLAQEPLLATLAGLAIGPYGLNLLALDGDDRLLYFIEISSLITLAIGLMGVALRLDLHKLKDIAQPALLLLTIGMAGMWVSSSLLIYWLIAMPFWMALLLGAIIVPTDPVVASSIVSGDFAEKHLSSRVRNIISLESGANDGLAILFFMLPLLMLQFDASKAWSDWLWHVLAYEVPVSFFAGAAIGYGASKLLHTVMDRQIMEDQSFLSYTITLSLLTLGMAEWTGLSGPLTVFIAGLAFNINTPGRQEQEEERIQESVSKLFTLPMFVLFGILIPLESWSFYGWPLLLLCLLVLLLRRLPVVLAMLPLFSPHIRTRDTLFIGWFGPLGVAAMFYATHAALEINMPALWHIASAIIMASIVAHGMTAAPLTRACDKDEG